MRLWDYLPILIFMIVGMKEGFEYCLSQREAHTVTLGISLFFPLLALPVAFTMMVIIYFEILITEIRQMFSR